MKSFIIFLVLLFPTLLFSQSNWQISGKVLERSQNPVPFANVFINNTSIGTTTDINGEFLLKIPAKIQKIDLVISFVGYTTLKKTIYKKDLKFENFVFTLQGGMELSEVQVIAKHDREWNRKWRKFKQALLGESDFYNACQILNPEVVRLEYNKNKILIATANEPLIIQNNAFGHRIIFQMEKFETDGNQTFYAGNKFFENIDTNSIELKKKWAKNKKKSYNDSFRNFLVSLAQRKLKENGFEIFKALQVKAMYFGKTTVSNEIYGGALKECTIDDICSYDSTSQQFILHSDYPIQVFATNRYTPIRVYIDYPNPYSLIELTNRYAIFTENGWLSKPNGILIKGFWGREGFSNLLPDDYFPEFKQKTEEQLASNGLTSLAPKFYKTDTLTKELRFQGIIYDNTPIAQEEKKEFAIVSNDINVKIGESDYNLTIFDLLRRIPGLMVINEQGQYRIHFRSTSTNLGGGRGSITPALVYDGTFIDDEETVMNILNNLTVSDIKSLGAVKYGNSAAFGARGANGTIVIVTNK
jgi:CarboxypepD_reg-like domain